MTEQDAVEAAQRAGLVIGTQKNGTYRTGSQLWTGALRKGRAVVATCGHQHLARSGKEWADSARDCMVRQISEALDDKLAQRQRQDLHNSALRDLAIREDAREDRATRIVAGYDARLAVLREALQGDEPREHEVPAVQENGGTRS
jgi:hypothetical protein